MIYVLLSWTPWLSPGVKKVGEVMWPSPPHFFASLTSCVADFNQPGVCYQFAPLLIWD